MNSIMDEIRMKEGVKTDLKNFQIVQINKTMIIREVKEELQSSNNPVAKSLHHGNSFKVLVMGFKKGMILKEHEAHIQSKLTVLEGAVVYNEENRDVKLMQYDEMEIPIDVTHSVEAIEDSLCLLTQGE